MKRLGRRSVFVVRGLNRDHRHSRRAVASGSGQYVADGKGGVPLGSHRVEIRAYRPMSGSAPAAVQAEGGPTEQYLPGKYNGRSNLTLEITADSGSQSIDFDLEP